ARESAGDHLLLRDRLPRGPGPHHRSARRVRLLARLHPRPPARVAGPPARPDLLPPRDAPAGGPGIRPPPPGGRAVALPPAPRPRQPPARRVSRRLGHDPGQLAAERLLARPDGRRRRHRRRGPATRRAGQAAQPLAPLLAPDGMSPARRPAG